MFFDETTFELIPRNKRRYKLKDRDNIQRVKLSPIRLILKMMCSVYGIVQYKITDEAIVVI
jgi:hypothetical protein